MDPRIYRQLREIESTHWWFVGRRRILLVMLDRMNIEAGSILDVGCGAGTNLDLFARRYPNSSLHGIDVELEALRFCRAERVLPVYRADVARLPFKDRAFDLISALDTLEHVADDLGTLRELFRVCSVGGTLLLTVPAFPFLWGSVDKVGHHYRRYWRKELIEKVVAAGFVIRTLRFFNCLLFPPIVAVRLAGRLVPDRNVVADQPVWTDFDVVKSGPLNTLLARLFSLEASLLAIKPPFGVSLLCVGERPRL